MYYSLPTGELVLDLATLTLVVMLQETVRTVPLVGYYSFTRVLQTLSLMLFLQINKALLKIFLRYICLIHTLFDTFDTFVRDHSSQTI